MDRDILAEFAAKREEPYYLNYLRVRDSILRNLKDASGAPSEYWRQELAGFEYMLDASPLIIEKLREHCYHITGIKSYEYRQHHAHGARPFEKKLDLLRRQDKTGLFVPESPKLGGFGHLIGDDLVNIDTLKFYETLIAMDKAGLLDAAKAGDKQVWMEIGAGWGGFGYAAKTLYPNLTYVIVDLPQTILFSATYLMSVFPDAKCAVFPEVPLAEIAGKVADYDFVFLPHFTFDDFDARIDLGINMVSFQEMTTEQVAGYARGLAEKGCPWLYSHNRDRSRHNSQLTAVSQIIAENYAKPREIKVLDIPYTTLVQTAKTKAGLVQQAKKLLGRGKPAKAAAKKLSEYRHLVAQR